MPILFQASRPGWHAALAALLVATLTAGCEGGFPAADVTVRDGSRQEKVLRHIRLDGDRIVVSMADGRKATISAAGGLALDGAAVELDAEQRSIARRFYTEALAVRSEGIAMGKAGAKMAGAAVSAVVTSLAQGEPEAIGDKVEAEAAVLERQALGLCERAAALQSAQRELAQAVPAFKPHAAMAVIDANDCR